MKSLVTLLIISSSFFILSSCTATAPIQSARVKSTFSVGAVTFYNHFDHKIYRQHEGFNDSTLYNTVSISHDSEHGEMKTLIRPNIKLGFSDKFEMSGFIVPFFPFFLHFEGTMKLALLDKGTNKLFRNIAIAGFVGGSGTTTEWDGYNNFWLGAVFGTHKKKNTWYDLELVFMPTLSIHGKEFGSDCNGIIYVDDKSLDLTFGLIYSLLDNRIELSGSVTTRIFLDNNLTFKDEPEFGVYHQIIEEDISNWAFHASLLFNFGKPKIRD